MRKVVMFSAGVALLLSAEGCDFFRKIAGRPTSTDIERKREIIADIARKQTEISDLDDTLDVIARELADSGALDVVDADAMEEYESGVRESIRSNGIKLSGSALASQAGKDGVTGRYVVIIGAFGTSSNAEALAARAGEASYETVLIPYTNGLVAVGVNPSDDLSEVYASLLKLKKESFCPSDVWILDKTAGK